MKNIKMGGECMDREILDAVTNLGFPMVLSWYLLLRMEKKMDAVVLSITDLVAEIRKHHG